MKNICLKPALGSVFLTLALPVAAPAFANNPGGITGTGPDVHITDNVDGTLTLSNGVASIVIVKKTARLNALTYTRTINGESHTDQILQGKGQYYYGGFSLGTGSFEYSLATDPATNGGNYADVKLLSTSDNKGVMEAHFSMLRGSPGFYSTAIMTHRPQDAAFEVGAWGVVTRVTPNFNWLSADPWHSFMIGTRSKSGVKVPNSPHEITVLLDGSQQGEYADKFIYGQDHADLRAWGWSSVGPGGLNAGMWLMTNMDFSNGGPMKRDVSVYPYAELNNSILTGELGQGSDGHFAEGEVWTKTCGPWFIYLNGAPASATDPKATAQILYQDALAQAEAEKHAWPYPWFKNPAYALASARGTVTGKFVISDPGNPNASPAGLWVGIEEQPQTHTGTYDFQKWLKPYQYWVQTAADGTFTIPNVLPGTNYSLWAYGPGAAGTFLSQPQNGGNPQIELDIPAQPFAVKVTAGETTQLSTITWTPKRVGPTVFEMGSPNRKADEFRHGDDYWAPAPSPKLGYPTPVWGGQMEFPNDFPQGMTFTVGKSRWATDWNYVLPASADAEGNYQACIGKITFTLLSDPPAGAMASLYIACAGDDGGKVIVSLNDNNLGSAANVTAAPVLITSAGFNPAYSDDSSIHFSNHGPFCDERLTFPAKMLHAGKNTFTIQMDAKSLTNYLMIDYLRLEMTGYVPPAPASVMVTPGKGRVLVRWPAVPGATSYTLLRSSAAGGTTTLATDILGPASGSDFSRASFTDTTAADGTKYSYSVQSTNTVGHSVPSPKSDPAASDASASAAAPHAPADLKVAASGHHKVVLAWNSVTEAAYYQVWRAALHSDGVGGAYPLQWIVLDDTVTTPAFTDDTPSDGRSYAYRIEAVNAGGTSAPSTSVSAQPVPPKPASAPASLAAQWKKVREGDSISLKWSAVPGATGYVIYRVAGNKTAFRWPTDFHTALVETTYLDKPLDPKRNEHGIEEGTDYSYQITAVNPGGISPPSTIHVAAR